MSVTDAASSILVAAIEAQSLTAEEKAFFEKERPAGVTLFRRNISPIFHESSSQVAQEIQSRLIRLPQQ